MRLIHFADLHLGFRQYQRLTPEGINQREADVARAFERAIERTIELEPDLIVLGGDVFHSVRPSNPAIIRAFENFSRLAREVPHAIVVMVAGNHDTPRATETGCILRLFEKLGIHVVESQPRRLTFEDRGLSILAVPDTLSGKVTLEPDPAFRYNVLVLHGEIAGVLPPHNDGDRVAIEYTPEEIGATRWNYVALGHYHVYHEIAPNACYSGSIEYTSPNIWAERREEKRLKIPGKGIVEFNLANGKRVFHPLRGLRTFIDLPPIVARGLSAADVDVQIRANVEQCPGGIEDAVVRQVVRDVPRHIAREFDHKAIREYKRRALHFHVDARRPDSPGPRSLGGRRRSLSDIVRDKLHSRPLASDVDRNSLVELGLAYLTEATAREEGALAAAVEGE
ncbi:MAG TPA: DNA repair exonuclease [Gemmatimonadaceae bacterium]|nr:DNA repair exonuclease [Gemmatimonadaceae bacterium]